MREILYTVICFALILFAFKFVVIILPRWRRKQTDILGLSQYHKKYDYDADEKFKQDFTALFSEKILTSDDINRMRTSLSADGLDPDLLFNSYKEEIQRITIEYLSIFWENEEKANSIYEKIINITSTIKSYTDVDAENIDGLLSFCSISLKAINKAKEYKAHTLAFDNSIQLKPKEEFYYSGRCILCDNSRGIEIGSLVNLNMAFNISDKSFVNDDNLLEKGNGNVILTSKRIVFSSPSITREMKYEEIINISAGENCIQITRTGKTRPEVFFFRWSCTDFWPGEYHTQLFLSVLLDILHSKNSLSE